MWEIKKILARSKEKWDELSSLKIFILLVLSKEESEKENICLKKRRETINSENPREHLKIKNFQLFKDGEPVNVTPLPKI